MRLIDADKLDDTIIRLNEEDWQITRYEYKRIDRVIFEMPTVQAVPIPDNATNGDVIKAIFSDNVFAEERWQDENGEMCTDMISDNGMTFTDIWWNSPYEGSDKE